MARGGKRQGAPGTAYQNRTDLNAPKPLAPTAVPGQPYGAAGTQMAGQSAVPMGPPPTPGPGAAASPPSVAAPSPESAGPFNRPTERPSEPITAGLPTGPGPGPEALPKPPDPVLNGAAVLNSLDELSPQLRALRSVVNATIANRAAP